MIGEDRRYEVFISSTAKDLRKAREALIETTIKCQYFPSAMELFTRVGARSVGLIEDCIRRADVFVILIGARYGSEIEESGKTYTKLEYDLAIKYKKPVLAFLLDEEEYSIERGKLPEGDPERQHDRDLREFRELVKQHPAGGSTFVQYFSLEDIGGLQESCTLALQNAVSDFDGRGGWIRGELYDELKSRTVLDKKVSENRFFKRFVDRLNTFDVLSTRVVEKVPHLKRAIADYFLDQYLGRMIESGVRNLFFESGSSIAFLSEAFIERLDQEDFMRDVSRDLNIQTNNVLTYLDFVLSERVQIELYPYGPPEAKYGATFGPLTVVPRREPPIHPHPLSKKARKAMEEVRDRLAQRYQEHGIIFMAASGVDLAKDSEFPGPHVGSFYNKLFKRAILESGCPTVIFLDETKIPQEFPIGECFSVCDQEFPWVSVCQARPLAIAVATNSEETARKLRRLLEEHNLCNIEDKYEKTACTLIASNQSFQSLWK
ncbi:MAG: DUF4062 domain-containing protein [Deltaproteobacteria bacterium]|nr:DUF4062 domain-containing protein [Deltaproteobacteria bacterium]